MDRWHSMGKHGVTITRKMQETVATIGGIRLTGVFEVNMTDKYLEIIGFDMVNQVTDDKGIKMPDYYHVRCFAI